MNANEHLQIRKATAELLTFLMSRGAAAFILLEFNLHADENVRHKIFESYSLLWETVSKLSEYKEVREKLHATPETNEAGETVLVSAQSSDPQYLVVLRFLYKIVAYFSIDGRVSLRTEAFLPTH